MFQLHTHIQLNYDWIEFLSQMKKKMLINKNRIKTPIPKQDKIEKWI